MRFIIGALLVLGLTGCATSRITENSFAFIEKAVDIKYCFGEICADSKQSFSGSGMIVGPNRRDRSRTTILTAGHVCSKHSEPPAPLRIENIEQKITVSDYEGVVHEATVIASSMEPDICLLETEWFDGRPAVFGRPLSKHEKVYAHTAPMGVWGPGRSIIAEGIYIGEIDGGATYTIPAAPGGSGGPVFNRRGHLVGMITMVLPPNYHVTIGPTLDEIKDFVEEHL